MAHLIKTLLEISRSLLENSDINVAVPQVLDLVNADMQAELAQIALYDDNDVAFKKARKDGQDVEQDEASQISGKILEMVMESNAAIVSANAIEDPRFAEPHRELTTVARLKLLSVACAPLRHAGKVLGVLYVDHRHAPARFSEDAGRLMELADLLAEPLQKLLDHARHQKRQEKNLQALEQKVDRLQGHDEILGHCAEIQTVREFITFMRDFDFNVLILGESGTGKELVAKALHRVSRRSHAPFVAFDCSGVPEGLLESELFGHMRGAFSGATHSREGIIEQAEGGTLFLDEIGNLSLAAQTKLLRFLAEKTYRRLGSRQEREANVRLIFATNKDLHALMHEKKFMPDLYYRLARGHTVTLPPLRKRGDDILLIAEALLKRWNQEHKTVARFNDAACAQLLRYTYPGNVRELDAIVMQAVGHALRTHTEIITPDHLRLFLPEISAPEPAADMVTSNLAGSAVYSRNLPEEFRDRNLITGKHSPQQEKNKVAHDRELHDQLLIAVPEAVGIPFKEARAAVTAAFERNFFAALLMATKGDRQKTIDLAQVDPKTFGDKLKEHGLKREWFVE